MAEHKLSNDYKLEVRQCRHRLLGSAESAGMAPTKQAKAGKLKPGLTAKW